MTIVIFIAMHQMRALRNSLPARTSRGRASALTASTFILVNGIREMCIQVEDSGEIRRTINLSAEICGHTFVGRTLYVIRGRENKDVPGKSEEWRLSRLDPGDGARIEDLATIPFASRSLTFDGEHFWSNHRAANEIIAFSFPK